MDSWSVDPDRVVGVLSAVDREGENLTADAQESERLWLSGGDALKADGRTALSSAWSQFMRDRYDVPGKAMAAIGDAAQTVSDGAVAILTGDEDMATEWRKNHPDAISAAPQHYTSYSNPGTYQYGG